MINSLKIFKKLNKLSTVICFIGFILAVAAVYDLFC